jgi:hypothetical protein
MVDIFRNPAKSIPKSDEQIVRVDMEQDDIAGDSRCKGPAGIDAARPQGPAGIDAARPQRMCFMRGCASGQGVTVAAATGPQPRKRKHRQKRELPQQVQLARGVGD